MKRKTPLYAALDLHSAYSVLGSMDHSGETQPRMRFATQAEILRAQVKALKHKRRPLHLTVVTRSRTLQYGWRHCRHFIEDRLRREGHSAGKRTSGYQFSATAAVVGDRGYNMIMITIMNTNKTQR